MSKIYFEDAYPDIAQSWDYQKNTTALSSVSRRNGKKYWWICNFNHSYQASAAHRSEGKGCPFCAGRKVLIGFNDFPSKYPNLLVEWADETSAYAYTVKSHYRALWRCSYGHAPWRAQIANRTAGNGCPTCSGRRIEAGKNDLASIDEFKYLLDEWSDNNSLQPTDVTRQSHRKIEWVCRYGHTWRASVCDRTREARYGCPKCCNKTSTPEGEIFNLLSRHKINNIISNDRKLIYPKEIDILLPEHKIAIEFNGLYWHSDAVSANKMRHRDKYLSAKTQGYQLITVWEDDWNLKRDVVESMLLHKIGIRTQKSIYARKCEVRIVQYAEAKIFLDTYHIQGGSRSGVYLALIYEDQIVAVAAFRKNKNNYYLDRYATSQPVAGGHSKLVSYFSQKYNYESLITFADLNISTGELYTNTGWTLVGEVPVDYTYLYKNKRVHKFNFRISRFKSNPHLKYENNMTELQLAKLNNLHRIWDCGKLKYTYTGVSK